MVDIAGELKQGGLHIFPTMLGLRQQRFIEKIDIPFIDAENGDSIQCKDYKKYESRYEIASDHQPRLPRSGF